jgi:hypothetical protein
MDTICFQRNREVFCVDFYQQQMIHGARIFYINLIIAKCMNRSHSLTCQWQIDLWISFDDQLFFMQPNEIHQFYDNNDLKEKHNVV